MTLSQPRPARPLPEAAFINLVGVKVSVLNLERAVRRIREAVADRRGGYVCVCGAHGIVEAQGDPALREALNGALMVTPDGTPLVWELRRQGHPEAGRVYGPDLMLAVLTEGGRHFLYGTTPATLAKLEGRLRQKTPRAKIVGSYSPPFRQLTETEEQDVADRIRASGAEIVWVGLSTPKQERFMASMAKRLDGVILIGVGAAFDFHAGNQRQAPAWMQRAGLEWFFRLKTEPRRLWRRYLKIVPGYLTLLALQRLGWRRVPLPQAEPAEQAG